MLALAVRYFMHPLLLCKLRKKQLYLGCNRLVGREGLRGFTLTPLGSNRFYMHRLTEYPTVWNWSSSFDAIENQRCQNKFVHGEPALNVLVMKGHVRKIIGRIKLMRTWCHPTCCSANLNNFFLGNSKSAGLPNAYVDRQKLDAILLKPCS